MKFRIAKLGELVNILTMFRCLPDFGPCFNYAYDQNSTDGIFIFHGFPSQKNRNKDLALFLSENTTASVFVHHYEGLGESLGKFSFERSIETAFQYVEHIQSQFRLQRLHFVGHSWGGFISLNLLPHFSQHLMSLVLYSPFTQIPIGTSLDELAVNLMKEYPHYFFHQSHANVCLEFKKIQNRFDYMSTLKSKGWQNPTLVLQAKDDPSTPEIRTKEVLPFLGPHVKYEELTIDHSFTQRRENTFLLTKQFYKNIQLAK